MTTLTITHLPSGTTRQCKADGTIREFNALAGGWRRVGRLKAGITPRQWFETRSKAGWLPCDDAPPTMAEIEEMISDGIAVAIDGCDGIEPDGHCEHRMPSWLLALGLI